MKIRKPDDEKFFKDIVLNHILEEISNEPSHAHEDLPRKKPLTQKKKSFAKKILFIGLGLLVLVFIMMIFNLMSDVTAVKEPQKPIVDKIPISTEVMTNTRDTTKPLKEKNTAKKGNTPLKTEREIAKEALRQQILN